MNTCKAALRILWSHKLYLFIYMFGLGTLMLVMGSSAITSADGQSGSTASFELVRPRIAVINTDGGKLGEGLSDYLAQTSHILPLSDDAQSLQDAVARNYVDLIVVIPSGYSQDFTSAAAAGERPPTVRTTVSYTSGSGSLAKINVDGYFSQVRTVLRSSQSQELSKAVDVVTKHIEDSRRNTSIDTVKTGDESGKSLANGFGLVMKLSIYPMFTAMTVCVSLLIGIFNTVETRRRLLAAPLKSVFLSVQQLLACLIIGLFCWLCYSVIALALVMPHNPGFSIVDAPSIGLPILTLLIFTLVSIAFGFMLGQFGISTSAANGVAVALGLVLMFTSGAAFDPSAMPDVMVAIGKLTPGWWFSISVDHALGISTASAEGSDVVGWLQSLGVMSAFGIAFLCIALAVGRHRSIHPISQVQKVTRLTEMG
jgi:ABC-2 type transport system permease protein